ncbi:uncharacterized protein J8A68_001018 [[Candida] subhashii]|uniref:Succinate dehydrogenase assembly factor 4, mitochondrial n=1 Tax=[Candida] subhashii TaxID=561895 RepID=A0A8J5V097_9ASCO|nr:uncharacterized protein J8A68_001018 [[Candida] subhashii]KAG7665330.1 hypothetical protein J8A68_001018 [[Candida] subhashii]
MITPIIKRSIVTKVFIPSTATRSFRFYSSLPKFGTDYQPGPPKLPKDQQEEFERLQNIANSQIAIEEYNEQINTTGASSSDVETPIKPAPALKSETDMGNFSYLKPIPDFEGDVNPKTGERGGPKQDPLKHADEWTYNGRVIDF